MDIRHQDAAVQGCALQLLLWLQQPRTSRAQESKLAVEAKSTRLWAYPAKSDALDSF
jgi:hypothetical protein